MPVNIDRSQNGKVVTISVSQRFDFNVHNNFREAYEQSLGPKTEYVIDLGATDYMDSSALGMLLLLREYAGGDKAKIKIINTKTEIKQILNISNFTQLFNVK